MEYKLLRSNRKTLAIEITREGEVLIRAPRHCPRSLIDELVERRSDWICKHLQLQQQRMDDHPEPDEQTRLALIEEAKAYIPARVEYFGEIMGLSPTGITITGAKKRFGSCSAKNRLCFSWRLMQYPPEAVDYVVVHELAHIVHKNHGKDFYRLIATVLPDWKQRNDLLKK